MPVGADPEKEVREEGVVEAVAVEGLEASGLRKLCGWAMVKFFSC